jgi:hypothetical protein
MKAILEFELPENEVDFNLALDGSKWSYVVWQLDQYLRSQVKHPAEGMSDDTYKAFDETRDKLYELLNEEGLKL